MLMMKTMYVKFVRMTSKYIEDLGTDKRNFRNLKTSLKRHINSKAHILKAEQAKQDGLIQAQNFQKLELQL